MKKAHLFLLLASALAMLTGCEAKQDKKTAADQPTVVIEAVPTPVVPPKETAEIPGVMISGWFYTLQKDKDGADLMVADSQAVVGVPVLIYGKYAANAEDEGVTTMKDVAVDGGGKRNFVKVRYDGDDYWVRDYAVAVNAMPGIVRDEGLFLYTRPSLSSMGTKEIANNTIVAVFLNPLEGEGSEHFFKIRHYVNDGKTYTVNGYLFKTSIIQNYYLVQMQQCLNKAEELQAATGADPAVIAELLENAKAFETAYKEK